MAESLNSIIAIQSVFAEESKQFIKLATFMVSGEKAFYIR